jgi:proton-translocating NAD(P)+ transhydrogenase subunit beta
MNITTLLNHGLDSFILGLVFLGIWVFRHPARAKKGNLIAGTAMVLAAGIVLFRHPPEHPYILAGALLIGSLLGIWVVTRIDMIQIPSMVAFQNGAGGLASFLIAFVELMRGTETLHFINELSGLFGLVMGAFTFSGSMIAAGKLANRLSQTPVQLKRHTFILGVNFLAVVGLISFSVSATLSLAISVSVWVLIIIAAALFGILFAIRVGGADMPVLISFLNATTGLAAALCGMVLGNQLLIACGAAVAASGSILTHIMCKAMNRSLYRVFVPLVQTNDMLPGKKNKSQTEPEEKQPGPERIDPLENVTQRIQGSKKIVIVPGYGMAVAQAQFEVIALADSLISMGKDVQFAIHPVAGRMPGHMNVLLAEAGIDYGLLKEMDDINPKFKDTDLVLVVGACDVVNPAAIKVNGSPISGMPILHVHAASHVACFNLDERPGYSGVDNPLYKNENTTLLLGDARQTLETLVQKINQKPSINEASNPPETHHVIASVVSAILAAKTVIIIPGYGMAQAQAQFEVVELSQMLEKMGKNVKFAIHPVAGRMPGHMNVLLAEADVEYDRLYEMDDINQDFQNTDVAIIFGACDVVNPAAIDIEGTPISGMPILMAHDAKKVIVCNYDAKPGYSGVENPLYENPKTFMATGDAKETADKLIKELKNTN